MLVSAVLFYLAIVLPLIAIAGLLHWADAYTERQQWANRQQAAARIASGAMLAKLPEAASDLSLLTEMASDAFGKPGLDENLAAQFRRFVRHRGIYAQVRFIDSTGRERVRVDLLDDRAAIVSAADLQDKSDRPYFVKGIALAPGQVYVSRFDLNVEHGRIEEPHKPVLRLVEPVYDEGRKRGVIVLNLDGRTLLEALASRDRNSTLDYWLVNEDGYWLFSEDPAANWGFQLTHGRNIAEYEGLADVLRGPPRGLIETPDGQFAFNRLELDAPHLSRLFGNASVVKINSEEKAWTLFTVVPHEELYSSSSYRLEIMTAVIAVVMALLLPGSYLWSRWRLRLRHDKERVQIYARVIEQSDELVYVTASDGTILFANPAVERLTGYRRDEIIGETPRLFKSGRQGRAFYDALWDKVSNREPFRAVFVNRRKDGTHFYENKIISPLVDKAGRTTHLVSTGRDISAEQERQEREMQLADQLSAQLSHHFNNLLAPIINYSEMAAFAAEENEQSGIRADIEKVLTGANRLRDVLAKISAMSLGAKLSQSVQPVGPIVSGIIEIERAALRNGITLDSELEVDMDNVGVEFDDLALMLSELISNARDAIDANGRIVVTARLVSLDGELKCSTCGEPMNGAYVDISVKDDGRGMSQAVLNQAFDPFFSTKQASKLVGETLGIGLSRVRNRVHANAGHVIVETREDVGTTVHIVCPVREMHRAHRHRRQKAAA